ncbi:type II secretion system F family protein [Massilia atriviolacea]|uniref:Type II secretion system F family protein n=1 Tax=Massilia atriviolacea TaxID=2495579 RepID=A0A430HPD7_9BURK|nr:type II secretion system F family protein [Massilia atriviolacea]RSZ59380.1 type II secretion system F family protein [Massilia atriviolacea]
MDYVFYGFAVLLFAAVILMVEGGWLLWSQTRGGGAQRIARRLRVMSGGTDIEGGAISILKRRRFSASDSLDSALHRLRLAHAIDRLLMQAGVHWMVAQFLAASLALLCAGGVMAHLWDTPPLLTWTLPLLGAALPLMVLRRTRATRLCKIEEQLPEAADFLARAMRAGHSFTNVMQMVGSELPEPLSGEFRTVHQEINYGVPMNEALHSLAERVPLTDLRYMVIAVLIQRESGGNLAEILGNIGHIIRERLKLLGQIRVLSAEGRISAWILGVLPFAVAGMMYLANPEYISMLWTDPAGIRLLGYAAVMICIGVVWLRKLIHIRV